MSTYPISCGRARRWLFLALVGLGLSCGAQAQTKVAIVNLQHVFDNYWKTKQADAELKQSAADYEAKGKIMVEDLQKAGEQYKKLLEEANNQILSAEERQKRKTAAEQKLIEARQIEQEVALFDRNAKADLAKQQRRMRDRLLDEIREVIAARAREGGYDLVLDSAAESRNETSIVLFHSGANDLTARILAELEARAPIELLRETERPDRTGGRR